LNGKDRSPFQNSKKGEECKKQRAPERDDRAAATKKRPDSLKGKEKEETLKSLDEKNLPSSHGKRMKEGWGGEGVLIKNG